MDSSRAVTRQSPNGRGDGGAALRSLLTFREAVEAPATGSHDLDQFGTAFANPGSYFSKDIEMLWPAVADEDGQYQVLIAPQYLPRPPSPPAPVPEIDEVYAAEAPLRRLLALASAVGLPQQIEREEADMVRRPQMPSFVTQGRVATLSVVGSRADGGELVFGSDVEEHDVPADLGK